MKFFSKILLITFTVTALLCGGCKGTPQRIAYTTTDALGNAVDKAVNVFLDYEVARAKNALGAQATQAEIYQWCNADDAYRRFGILHHQYISAYTAWVSANAAAATGTIADPQFRTNAINAAFQLTSLIQSFIPTVKVVQ